MQGCELKAVVEFVVDSDFDTWNGFAGPASSVGFVNPKFGQVRFFVRVGHLSHAEKETCAHQAEEKNIQMPVSIEDVKRDFPDAKLEGKQVVIIGYDVNRCPFSKKAVDNARLYVYGNRLNIPPDEQDRILHIMVQSRWQPKGYRGTMPVVLVRDNESGAMRHIGGGDDMQNLATLEDVGTGIDERPSTYRRATMMADDISTDSTSDSDTS